MIDVLEATRSVTEPAMQYRYVNAQSGAAGRSTAPPVSSCTITCASALAVSGQRLSRLQCSKGVETLLS